MNKGADTRIKIKTESGVVTFGLIDFFDVLVQATQDFLEKLETDAKPQKKAGTL